MALVLFYFAFKVPCDNAVFIRGGNAAISLNKLEKSKDNYIGYCLLLPHNG